MRRSESLLAAEGVSWGTMCKASALPSGWGEKGVEWTVGGWGHGAWGMVCSIYVGGLPRGGGKGLVRWG